MLHLGFCAMRKEALMPGDSSGLGKWVFFIWMTAIKLAGNIRMPSVLKCEILNTESKFPFSCAYRDSKICLDLILV